MSLIKVMLIVYYHYFLFSLGILLTESPDLHITNYLSESLTSQKKDNIHFSQFISYDSSNFKLDHVYSKSFYFYLWSPVQNLTVRLLVIYTLSLLIVDFWKEIKR